MITNSSEIFPQNIVNVAIKHARSMFPHESCGAVIENKYVSFENTAEENKDTGIKDSFLINSSEFDLAYKSEKIQCIIHSHNNFPHASVLDQDQQKELDVPFCIINLRQASVLHTVFWGNQVPEEPLKGRNYFFGVWDCYAIIKDFMKKEFKLIAPNPSREYDFCDKGESIFEQFTTDGLPFYEVSKQKAQPNDLLFYNIHGTQYINHCAVFKKNGLALHHFAGRISKDYPISFQGKFIQKVIRFSSDMVNNMNTEEWGVVND